MKDSTTKKLDRILDLNMRFLEGDVVNKKQTAEDYHVNERTIQRDIEYLRIYYAEKITETGKLRDIVYDRTKNGYILRENSAKNLSNGEALAVSKILLESRAFPKEEMFAILDKIVDGCVPYVRKKEVKDLITNEEFYYIPLQHNKKLIPTIWKLGESIINHKKVGIHYLKMDGISVERKIKPVGILFSEFYFYLIAFLNEDSEVKAGNMELIKLSPAIYRIDRIQSYTMLNEVFDVPYKDRFQEGEFRKRIQFMYGGPLHKVRFEYSGKSIEAVLDRLPTAVIEKESNGVYTVSAEVFGTGINMWFGSQGTMVKVL